MQNNSGCRGALETGLSRAYGQGRAGVLELAVRSWYGRVVPQRQQTRRALSLGKIDVPPAALPPYTIKLPFPAWRSRNLQAQLGGHGSLK